MTNYTTKNLGHTIQIINPDSDRLISSSHALSSIDYLKQLKDDFDLIRGRICHLDASKVSSLTLSSSGDNSIVEYWANADQPSTIRTEQSGEFAINKAWWRKSPHNRADEVYLNAQGQHLSLGEQLDSQILGSGKAFTVVLSFTTYGGPFSPANDNVTNLLSKYSADASPWVDSSFALTINEFYYKSLPLSYNDQHTVSIWWCPMRGGQQTTHYVDNVIYVKNGWQYPTTIVVVIPYENLIIPLIHPSVDYANGVRATLGTIPYLINREVFASGGGEISYGYHQGNISQSMIDSTVPLVIGPWHNTQFWGSSPNASKIGLHDIVFYNRALSSGEAQAVGHHLAYSKNLHNFSTRNPSGPIARLTGPNVF
jgi:hypothetical protein